MASRKDKKEASRPAVYTRLESVEEKALERWIALHAAEKMSVYRIGGFAFMSMSNADRLAWAKRYNDWKEQGFPAGKLDGLKD